jgi:hypothetical protein
MKIFQIFIASYGTFLLLIQNVFAKDAPTINCYGLPGCIDPNKANPTPADVTKSNTLIYITEIISTMLQYVTVIAVITLMISGVMYLLSGWEEEKVNKAKNWIIWSLVWVLVSMSSWFLVSIINDFGKISPVPVS